MSADWKKDVLVLAALYLMLERFESRALLNSEESTPVLLSMETAGLVRKFQGEWAVTEAGRSSMKNAVAAQDVLRQFEIFAAVDLSVQLQPEDLADGGALRPDAWDPRFAEGEGSFDMRMAVMSWLSYSVTKKTHSPHMLVFLQKLGSGAFSVQGFWGDVQASFAEVEQIVSTQYRWTEVDTSRSLEACDKVMRTLYEAGQTEQRKRDGSTCSGCGIPLYVFEQKAAEVGEFLAKCPLCPHVFTPTVVEASSMICPKCRTAIAEGDPYCGGCGATMDFSLPAGSVSTETTATTETVWSQSYGYVSYGWLDPFDPYRDVRAFDYLYYDPYYY